jgi:TetR/AcrR family transcriptional regulator, tetracycline repressor protein
VKVSPEIILEAAFRLLAANGIEGISIRKLQAELHITAPSIYWYYKNKQQLINAMSDFIISLTGNEALALPNVPWQEWLRQTLSKVRVAVLSYRDGAQVIATAGLLGTPSLARLVEDGLTRMQAQGVGNAQASITLFACLHYATGHLLQEQSARSVETDQTDFLIRYPRLRSAVMQKRQNSVDSEEVYLAGLNLLLS